MLRTLFIAGACAAALSISMKAAAADEPWTPRSQGSRLGGDISWWGTRADDAFSFAVTGQIQVARAAYIDFEVPWAVVGHDNPGRDASAIFGNLVVGAHYGGDLNRRVALYVGGTLSIPTTLDPNIDELAISLQAVSASAYADIYRYSPSYVYVRPRFGLEIQILPVLYYTADFAPVIVVPAGEYVHDPDFYFVQAHDIEARAPNGAGGGVRLQSVFFSSRFQGERDQAQLAIEPFFAYEPRRGHFYARVGALLALDPPLGFGFDRGKVATLRASLGGKW